jgi:hypothetical protein
VISPVANHPQQGPRLGRPELLPAGVGGIHPIAGIPPYAPVIALYCRFAPGSLLYAAEAIPPINAILSTGLTLGSFARSGCQIADFVGSFARFFRTRRATRWVRFADFHTAPQPVGFVSSPPPVPIRCGMPPFWQILGSFR